MKRFSICTLLLSLLHSRLFAQNPPNSVLVYPDPAYDGIVNEGYLTCANSVNESHSSAGSYNAQGFSFERESYFVTILLSAFHSKGYAVFRV
jgi:hypothetical protein